MSQTLAPTVRRVILNRPSAGRDGDARAGRWAFLLADMWDADLGIADLRDPSAVSLLRDPDTALVTAFPPPARRRLAHLARIAGPLIGVPRTVVRRTSRRLSEVVCAISAPAARRRRRPSACPSPRRSARRCASS